MMSMSMYRPRRSQQASSRVIEVTRSASVPTNLPEVAHEFIQVVVEKSSTDECIPKDTASSINSCATTSSIYDSIRSTADEDELFLPFDEELQVTPEEEDYSEQPQRYSTTGNTKQKVAKCQQQQQHRHDAIVSLEDASAFCDAAVAVASPVSVLDYLGGGQCEQKVAAKPSSTTTTPKRNMFGQIMQEEPVLILSKEPAVVAGEASLSEPEPLFEMETKVPPTTASTHHARQFAMLGKMDRANSLPIECTSRTRNGSFFSKGFVRKPSLKNISSIGKFPPNRQDSEESLKRTVSFSNLQIREYNVALSDHPSCSFGPPVQLSWDYQERDHVSVESYEESREPRRDTRNLVLSYYDRRFMLLKQAGYSKRQVKAAVKEVERVKRERMVTELFLPASPLDETMEHVIDTVKTFFKKQEKV